MARVEAEKEYALKKEELGNAILAKQIEIDAKIVDNDKISKDKLKKQDEERKAQVFEVIQATLDGFSQLFSAIASLDQVQTENKLKGVKKGSEEEKKILQASFERQKRLSIVTTLINGASAVVAALSTPDPTFGILSGIRIAFAVTTTAIQIAAIQSKQFSGGGDSGGGGGGGGSITAPPPPLSTAAPSTIGLGQGSIAPQKESSQFQRVYVVESDIRNTTNRVEVIENRSVLGS